MAETSLAQSLASLPSQKRRSFIAKLSPEEVLTLTHYWRFWARPEQLPPDGDWVHWLIMTGRGWGKTRTGAEFVRERTDKGLAGRWGFIAKTPADARDVMIEGESGILAIYPECDPNRPSYQPTKRRLEWPNGAMALVFSSAEPDQLRGPQHDAYWADELASWHYPKETWDSLMFGFRLGTDPRGIITTTPKPIALLRDLVQNPNVHITKGHTYDNLANLNPVYRQTIVAAYEGTTYGRQELGGELLAEVEGALWKLGWIEAARRSELPPNVWRIVVAVDPPGASGVDSAECGIVAAALAGKPREVYILADRSRRGSPHEWAKAAVDLYRELKADALVGEQNFGGEMVGHTIRSVEAQGRAHEPPVNYKTVTASRSKQVRAEPIAAMYEQGRVHHLGVFSELEDQLCTWVPGDKSPDRLDALVWAVTELLSGTIPTVPSLEGLNEDYERVPGWKVY